MDYESTTRSIQLPSGTMHYHEAGDGKPLLMLHGSGPGVSGWANFGGTLGHFSRQFRVIVPDLPGYGKSASIPGTGMHEIVPVIIELLDALNISEADVIGNSLGGALGGVLAASHPDRVRRLVSIGGIGVYSLSAFPAEGLLRLVEFVEEPTRERMAAWLRSMVFDEALVTDEMIDARMALATQPEIMATSQRVYSRVAFKQISAFVRGPEATQGFAHLPKIKAPTLLAWGRDDRVNPLDGALLPSRLIPNCELHVFPNCGHWSMIEQKEAFESAVFAFLTRP